MFLLVFQLVFVILRTSLIGSKTASGFYEITISLLPELILSLITAISIIQHRGNIIFSRFDKIMLLYFFSNVILGFILGGDLIISIFGFRTTYFPMLSYFIVRISLNKDDMPGNFENILKWFSFWFLFAAVFGLLMYFVFDDFEQQLMKVAAAKNSYYYIRRMAGVYLTPVVWGTFCALISLFYFVKYAQSKHLYTLAASITIWFCMVLSVSRGAIIPFYLGMIFITIVYRCYKSFFQLVIASSLVFFIYVKFEPLAGYLVGFVSSSSIETMDRISSEEAHDVISDEDTAQVSNIKNTRAKFWALSIRSFKNKPSGYGLGKAGHVANKYKGQLKDAKNASIYSTDGWYLKLINETGIWGGFSYLFLFTMFIYGCIQKFSIYKKDTTFVFGLTIVFMIALQNVMSNVLDFYSFPILYWMIIGFMQNFIEKKHD